MALSFVHFIQWQNRLQNGVGRTAAWLGLTLVALSALVVVLRYGFDWGDVAWQEAILYNHAVLFMLGMAYTLQQNKHVRVDVFYNQMPAAKRAWIDLIGALVLALPSMVFIVWVSWDYVAASWTIYEASSEAGGLPIVYLLKSVILLMAGLMISQILAMAAEAGLVIFAPENDDFQAYLASKPTPELEESV